MRTLIGVSVGLVILLVSAGLAFVLYITRTTPESRDVRVVATRVEAAAMTPSDTVPRWITAQGTVEPARFVEITPEVSGRVEWTDPELTPGGMFAADAPILKVEQADYKTALAQRKSELAKAEMELTIEKGKRRSARLIEELTEGKTTPEAVALRLRAPHIAAATAILEAATEAVHKAERDLERTTLRAPFASVVLSENVEVGQYITAQSHVATLIGTDSVWIRVSLPAEKVLPLRVPGYNAGHDESGAKAVVRLRVNGGKESVRKGHVVRLMSDLDPSGRLARLIIEIDDPFGLKDAERGIPLLLNSYVTVEIEGEPLTGVYVIPRSAVSEQDTVQVADAENKLQIRPIEITWRDASAVYVRSGFESGDRLLIRPLAVPVRGMSLEVNSVSLDGSPVAADSTPEPVESQQDEPSHAEAVND